MKKIFKMTVLPEFSGLKTVAKVRGYFNQLLMVILINIPTISFGLAMGWVSLASGEGTGGKVPEMEMIIAAGTTFLASLVGVPLSARAVASGRKLAVIATSACFVVCWSLKLVGTGWWLVAARTAAGLGGAGAWTVSPLLAREMCESRVRGAAVAALVLAHNLGVLLMYLAADAGLAHRTVLYWCMGLSAVHCIVFLLVPESPSYLAANGKDKEARSSLAWLRGMHTEDPALTEELSSLPSPEEPVQSPIKLTKEMLSDNRRRKAFIISGIAVLGQEMCGVLALLQFAERVFVITRDQTSPEVQGVGQLMSPARHAVILGAVQLVASICALYLVERIGRRPLIVSTAFITATCLGIAGVCVWCGCGACEGLAAAALAGAVAADSAGLQPAPYALLADIFTYKYRGCALMLVTAAGCIGNTLEVIIFPAVASYAGLSSALALAATLTFGYAVFAAIAVPETKGRTPEEIYESMCEVKNKSKDCSETVCTKDCSETLCTKNCSKTGCTKDCSETLCTKDCSETLCTEDCSETVCTKDCSETVCTKDCSETLCTKNCSKTGCTKDCSEIVCTKDCSKSVCTKNCSKCMCIKDCSKSMCTKDCSETLCTKDCSEIVCTKDCSETLCTKYCSETLCTKYCSKPVCTKDCSKSVCTKDCTETLCSKGCSETLCTKECNETVCTNM